VNPIGHVKVEGAEQFDVPERILGEVHVITPGFIHIPKEAVYPCGHLKDAGVIQFNPDTTESVGHVIVAGVTQFDPERVPI